MEKEDGLYNEEGCGSSVSSLERRTGVGVSQSTEKNRGPWREEEGKLRRVSLDPNGVTVRDSRHHGP